MENLNYTPIRLLLAFLALVVVTHLSSAVDFIGEPKDRSGSKQAEAAESVGSEPVEEAVEEPVEEPVDEAIAFKPDYVFMASYPEARGTFEENMRLLPKADQYIVVYGTENCEYCDQLMTTLKSNNKTFTLVYVDCKRSVRGLYSESWFSAFPSFEIIQDGKLTTSGVGAYSWDYFKQFDK